MPDVQIFAVQPLYDLIFKSPDASILIGLYPNVFKYIGLSVKVFEQLKLIILPLINTGVPVEVEVPPKRRAPIVIGPVDAGCVPILIAPLAPVIEEVLLLIIIELTVLLI